MAVSTVPVALTKPGAGADTLYATIGTKNGFLAAWSRAENNTLTFLLQRFDAAGKPIGKPVEVDSMGFGGARNAEFVALGGDKYGMVYTLNDELRAVTVDGAGKVSKPVTIVDGNHSSLVNDLALLKNGKIALVTRDYVDFLREDTVLLQLDKSMKPIGSPKIVEQDKPNFTGSGTYQQTIVSNDKGGVVFYLNDEFQLSGRTFGATGALGKEFQVNATKLKPLYYLSQVIDFEVKAEELDWGGYVATWSQTDKDDAFDLRARIFTEGGKPVGKEFTVSLETLGHQDAPEILAFKDCFAIAWTDQAWPFAQQHTIRFFDKTGKAISDDIVTEYNSGGDTEYARLSDGSYAKLSSLSGAVYADGVAAPKIGNGKNNVIEGKAKAEIILGAGGNDKLLGGDGADTLDGGSGNDTLEGGGGSDMLIGGAGRDLLIGGDKGDIFVFRPGGGTDTVQKFDSADRIDASAFHYRNGGHQDVVDDARQVGKNVVIDLDGDAGKATVILLNMKLEDFTAADVIL